MFVTDLKTRVELNSMLISVITEHVCSHMYADRQYDKRECITPAAESAASGRICNTPINHTGIKALSLQAYINL